MKNMGQIVEQVLITPELAKGFLERNYKGQRSIRKSYVRQLATVMKNGRFMSENGQSIVIGAHDGVLYDGQHRLTAIVESGVSLKMLVSFVDNGEEIFGTLDNGTRRGVAEFFDIPNKNECGAVFKQMACVEWGDAPLLTSLSGNISSGQPIDRCLVQAYGEQNKQRVVESVRTAKHMRATVDAGPKTGYAMFIELVTYCETSDFLEEFINDFNKTVSSSPTVTTVKMSILKAKASKLSKGIPSRWLLGILLDAYTHYCQMDGSTMLNKQDRRLEEYSKKVQAKRERTRKASS